MMRAPSPPNSSSSTVDIALFVFGRNNGKPIDHHLDNNSNSNSNSNGSNGDGSSESGVGLGLGL